MSLNLRDMSAEQHLDSFVVIEGPREVSSGVPLRASGQVQGPLSDSQVRHNPLGVSGQLLIRTTDLDGR